MKSKKPKLKAATREEAAEYLIGVGMDRFAHLMKEKKTDENKELSRADIAAVEFGIAIGVTTVMSAIEQQGDLTGPGRKRSQAPGAAPGNRDSIHGVTT